MTVGRWLGLGLAMAGLAACAGPAVVSGGDPWQRIDSFYNYGAAGRDLPLVISGNPFAVAQPAFERAVEARLQGPMGRPATRPALVPDASARHNYRLVLAFQPPPTVGGPDLCADPPPSATGPARDHAVEVVAAFCVSGRALTWVSGWTDAQGVDDPVFGDLLHGVMMALFRPDRQDRGGHGGGATLF